MSGAPACRRGATLVVLVLTLAPRPGHAGEQTLLLDVNVNGYATGKVGEFVLRDGVLLARRSELLDLGFRVPGAAADGLTDVAGLHWLSWRVDQATQRLYVTAPIDSLTTARLAIGPAPSARGPVESGTGVTLDYDVTAAEAGGIATGGGLFDLRAFSPWGVVNTGVLVHLGGGFGGGAEAIRLDSTYTFSDPERLLQYRVGDFISGGLGWTRAVRLGGIQIGSNFALRPDLVTFPVPAVRGAVAVPSTLDVLVNGQRVLPSPSRRGRSRSPSCP